MDSGRNLLKEFLLYQSFRSINRDFFFRHPHARYTLFEQDPRHQFFIVPTLRYTEDIESPEEAVRLAKKSQVRFRPYEGLAGKALVHPHVPFLLRIPDFRTPEQLRRWIAYKSEAPEEAIKRMSSYTQKAKIKTLFCIGLADADHGLLGVLSFDLPEIVDVHDGEVFVCYQEPPSLSGFAIDRFMLEIGYIRGILKLMRSF